MNPIARLLRRLLPGGIAGRRAGGGAGDGRGLPSRPGETPEELLRWALERLPAEPSQAAKLVADTLGDAFLAEVVRARSDTNDSLFYAHHVFAEIDALSRKHGLAPGTVLEIGPGANLGSLFCFAASGVAQPAGVDVEPLRPPGRSFYAALYDYLACVEGFSWWRYFATARVYPGAWFPPCATREAMDSVLARIDYRAPVTADALPFPDGSFDLVYSVAVLEHVPKPAETVAEIRRVLRPGGLAIHEIDVKHHGSEDPLAFLSWSDEAYLERAEPYGEGRSLSGILEGSWQGEVFTNRLRQSDWRELFDRGGLRVLEVEPNVVLEPRLVRREAFVEPFRSKTVEDLAVLAFRIVARAEV